MEMHCCLFSIPPESINIVQMSQFDCSLYFIRSYTDTRRVVKPPIAPKTARISN